MSEQELDLFKLSTVCVAQLGAGPAQVMRRDVLEPDSLTALSYYVPNNVLGDPGAPDLAAPRHGAEYLPVRNTRG